MVTGTPNDWWPVWESIAREAPEARALLQAMGVFQWGQISASEMSSLFHGQEARAVTSSSLPCPRECHLQEAVGWSRYLLGDDPVLKNNFISYSCSDSVVIGECGKGLIEGNTTYGKETNPDGG